MFSELGGGIGLAVGALAVPLTLAVTARPPVKSTTLPVPVKAHRRDAWHNKTAAVIVPVAVCGVTGARIGPGWVLPAFLAVGIGLSAAGLIDAWWRLLPTRVVYLTWAAGLVGMAAAAVAHHRYAPLVWAIAGGGAVFAVFVPFGLTTNGLSFGDVRLLGLVGSTLGWWGLGAVAGGLIAGFVAAAIVSAALIGLGRATRHTEVSLGSWLGIRHHDHRLGRRWLTKTISEVSCRVWSLRCTRSLTRARRRVRGSRQ
jgi:leader peptidase (prepilin peptidase)/N-methyltransferase